MTYNIWAIQAIQNQFSDTDSTPKKGREKESDFLGALRNTMEQSSRPSENGRPAAAGPASLIIPYVREVDEFDLTDLTSKKGTRRYMA